MNRLLCLLIFGMAFQYILAETNQERCDRYYDLNNIVYIEIGMDDNNHNGRNDWQDLKNDDGQTVDPETGEKDYLWYTATWVKAWGDHWPEPAPILNVGIKKKGGVGSNDVNKTAFKLDFGKWTDNNNDIADAQIGTHFLTLNNAKQDETFMRQCVQNRICKIAGMPFQRCNLAHVWVNGYYEGIYVNVESLEKRLIKNVFRVSDGSEGDAHGNLYELGNQHDFNGNDNPEYKGWSGLTADFATAGSYISGNADRIAAVFDLNAYQKFFGMEILLKHWDGYNNMVNNAYVYNDAPTIVATPQPNNTNINFKFIISGSDQVLKDYNTHGTPIYWTRYNSSVLAQLTNNNAKSLYGLNTQTLNLLNTVFDPTMYYSIWEPYLDNMARVLKTMKDYQRSISFNEFFYPNWSYDPIFIKNQLKQVYTNGYQTILGMELPSDRSINVSPIWIEDALPSGAIGLGESWNWVTNNVYSGSKSHQSQNLYGSHQHYFDYSSTGMTVKTGDELYTYVYLDPTNTPKEVMLQWRYGSTWKRAFWGPSTDKINYGPCTRIGDLPLKGQWARLSVPASLLGLENQTIIGMAFSLYDGMATWDCSGVFNPVVIKPWIEDALPSGAIGAGESWNWVTTNVLSGAKAHQSPNTSGTHQHYFGSSTTKMFVKAGSMLYTYVYLDPTNTPTEVMLQWTTNGTAWIRAYWGNDQISWSPRINKGILPTKGVWTRLSVPASELGLENQTVTGMAFTLYGGSATWDCSGVLNPVPPAWVEDNLPPGAIGLGTGGDSWNWVTTNVFTGSKAHQSLNKSGSHQHYFEITTTPMVVRLGSVLYTYVKLDPVNTPEEVMLQWRYGSTWKRAYWGPEADKINYGPCTRIGDLPAKGVWVKLPMPASMLGLENQSITGMAFSLYGGMATWDHSGVE
jgi:hypothetical protein